MPVVHARRWAGKFRLTAPLPGEAFRLTGTPARDVTACPWRRKASDPPGLTARALGQPWRPPSPGMPRTAPTRSGHLAVYGYVAGRPAMTVANLKPASAASGAESGASFDAAVQAAGVRAVGGSVGDRQYTLPSATRIRCAQLPSVEPGAVGQALAGVWAAMNASRGDQHGRAPLRLETGSPPGCTAGGPQLLPAHPLTGATYLTEARL